MSGIQYLTDGLIAVTNNYAELKAYRVYHTDCLYLICRALSNDPGIRYYDMVNTPKEEERSCESIVSERLNRFGIEVID